MADGFLGRWSRRKVQARTGQPLAEPSVPPVAAVLGACQSIDTVTDIDTDITATPQQPYNRTITCDMNTASCSLN